MKWELDFIGPMKTIACFIGNHCILVTIDYITKWVEVKVLLHNTTQNTTKFITFFTRPTHLVNDERNNFIKPMIKVLIKEFMITHHKFPTYYPQVNLAKQNPLM
jgi:hypothetical protein